MRQRSGITLVEIIVALSIFTLIGTLLAVAFVGAGDVWRNVSSSTTVQTSIGKGRDRITRDLKQTSFDSVSSQGALSSLGALDGDALWFLSARNPATGEFVRKIDGTPFWQTNVLYYLVVPSNHSTTFGVNCSGAADAGGYEEQCPHKVLIRKVIDQGAPTDLNDESTAETPIPTGDIAIYLSRPAGFDTTGMNGEAGLREVAIPATHLLSFRALTAPDPQWPNEVRVALTSVAVEAARREVPIGQAPLSQSVHASRVEFSVFPEAP